MKKLMIIALALSLSGCATFNVQVDPCTKLTANQCGQRISGIIGGQIQKANADTKKMIDDLLIKLHLKKAAPPPKPTPAPAPATKKASVFSVTFA